MMSEREVAGTLGALQKSTYYMVEKRGGYPYSNDWAVFRVHHGSYTFIAYYADKESAERVADYLMSETGNEATD